MKIKITMPPGIGKEHGVTEGRVFDVFDYDDNRSMVVIEGDANELVHLYQREYEIIEGSIDEFDEALE